MLILISPAKTLDFETPVTTRTATQPAFLDRSGTLIGELQGLSPAGVSSLMGISDKLGRLNHERFAKWHTPFTRKNARQAVLAFKGDVYRGLEAESFTAREFKFAQQHLRILSGLYGLLRPLDLIQPYRLEMGTRFANTRGKDLYQFWGDDIAEELNTQLKSLKTDTVVNLASNEYFRAVNRKILNAEVILPAFKDLKNGAYKIISFYAKKARGQMAAWIIRNGVTDAKQLKKFRVAGYHYNAELSKTNTPTFTRNEVPVG